MKKRFEEDDELDRLPEGDEPDKFLDDEELKRFLEEECVKEAEAMVAALFSEEDVEEYNPSDEEVRASYEKLVARLKADGIYREDETDDAVVPDRPADTGMRMETAAEFMPDVDGLFASAQHFAEAAEPEKIIPIHAAVDTGAGRSRKSRVVLGAFRKVIKYVVACTICLVFVSVSGEAGRSYFVEKIRLLSGDDTRFVIDNDENNEIASTDEYEAIDDIEKQLGVEVPEIFYRPRYFEFIDYEVDKYVGIARLEYQYNKNIITLIVDKENEDTASKLSSLHGGIVDRIPIEEGSINIIVKKVQDIQDEEPSYFAQWEKDDIGYLFFGKMEQEEFIKILEDLSY